MTLLYSNLSALLKRYGIDSQAMRQLFRNPKTMSGNMALWDQHDPRLELASFSGTVPTFIVNQDQMILDWNPAFHLVFGKVCKLKKNISISTWYEFLENFRRVENRTEEFFGESILPIADRHRIVFISPKYGRMVFTKIMSPMIDRNTGRILGWSISLNINSVNKRNDFLEDLFATIKRKTENQRFIASYDGVFANSAMYQHLVREHALAHQNAETFLELNARTGELCLEKASQGARVSASHGMIEFLRTLRNKAQVHGKKINIVERQLNDIKSLPSGHYQGIAMMHGLYRKDRLDQIISKVFDGLQSGGVFTYSQLLGSGKDTDVVTHYLQTIKGELEEKNLFDNIKYQFNHVSKTFAELEADRIDSRQIVTALKQAGFKIKTIKNLDYHYAVIVAVKP